MNQTTTTTNHNGHNMKKPNILLILCDQMSWDVICDRTICRTPNLNRLASEGMRFERSYTPYSLCCPARAMLLTGAYPWDNGVFTQVHHPESVHPDMFNDVVTYSQRLIAAGYRAAYGGKWHASAIRGPADFGYEDVPLAEGREAKLIDSKSVNLPGGGQHMMWGSKRGDVDQCHMGRLARGAASALGDLTAGDAPWLLEVHFPEPHDPYVPCEQFLNRYDLDDIQLPANYSGEEFANKPDLQRRHALRFGALTETDIREGRRHYYAYCEQLDYCIGKVLDALDASGAAKDTLVVLGADHGELLGAHRMFHKGWMPYEENHRIPMLARLPGRIPAGSSTDALVQLHDWAHTFVSLAGAEPLPYAQGKDLTPLLENPVAVAPLMPAHILNCYYGAGMLVTQRIAIGKRYKYVFNGFSIDEFYDMEKDPGEIRNAIDDPTYAEALRETRDALWELMIKLEDPLASHMSGPAGYIPGHSKGLNIENCRPMSQSEGRYFGHWKGPRPVVTMPRLPVGSQLDSGLEIRIEHGGTPILVGRAAVVGENLALDLTVRDATMRVDRGAPWLGASVEIFAGPEPARGKGGQPNQFILIPADTQGAAEVRPLTGSPVPVSGWMIETVPGGWRARVQVPLSAMGIDAAAAQFRFDILCNANSPVTGKKFVRLARWGSTSNHIDILGLAKVELH
jgi:arylsulfatase A-like enzyme